jgi:hypothetical protein
MFLGGVPAYAVGTGGVVALDFTVYDELTLDFYHVSLVLYP